MAISSKTFVTLRFMSYRGMKGPVAHILSFKHSMAPVRQNVDVKVAMLCKMFVLTL